MALTDIVALADIETELGGGLSAADSALLDLIRLRTEALIRTYVRWNITEATYTHFLPFRGPIAQKLQLPQPYVTAVASVYEDRQSRGGQQSGDFDSTDQLVVGTDFWIDYDATDYSREGILHRYGWDWPCIPRSVKVTYTSGFDAAALANEFLYVQDAVINETINRFHFRKQNQGSTGIAGTVKREKLKDYEIEYDTSSSVSVGNSASKATGQSGLSDLAKGSLDPIMFMGRMI